MNRYNSSTIVSYTSQNYSEECQKAIATQEQYLSRLADDVIIFVAILGIVMFVPVFIKSFKLFVHFTFAFWWLIVLYSILSIVYNILVAFTFTWQEWHYWTKNGCDIMVDEVTCELLKIHIYFCASAVCIFQLVISFEHFLSIYLRMKRWQHFRLMAYISCILISASALTYHLYHVEFEWWVQSKMYVCTMTTLKTRVALKINYFILFGVNIFCIFSFAIFCNVRSKLNSNQANDFNLATRYNTFTTLHSLHVSIKLVKWCFIVNIITQFSNSVLRQIVTVTGELAPLFAFINGLPTIMLIIWSIVLGRVLMKEKRVVVEDHRGAGQQYFQQFQRQWQ